MDTFPKPVPGPALADLRRQVGVEQQALAAALGIHRITLRQWEKSAEVDAIRVGRYQHALRSLVSEAIPESAA